MLNRWLHVRDCSSFFAMNDPELAAALRSRSPDALPELLDAYGDQVFSYCWRLLRNRENAQIAMRDALVIAIAQIGHLFCDEWLGSWLYCLARAECRRREAVPAADADEPPGGTHQADADSRLVTWKAVTSMDADEVEALELDCRPDVDLRLVLGLSAAETEELLDRARRNLERALAAEILIRKSHACPNRAEVLSDWTGVTTPAMRDRLLEHAAACSACGPHLPRSVSPARVFALLPAPVLSSVARLEVLEFFGDSRKAAYREFTVSRAEDAAGSWFLGAPEPTEPAPLPDPDPPRSWFEPEPDPMTPDPITPDLTSPEKTDIITDPASHTDVPPEPVPSRQTDVPEPAPSGYADVAQGFIGSWLSPAGAPAPAAGPPTEPIGSPLRLASGPASSESANAPQPAIATGPASARKPALATGLSSVPGPASATGLSSVPGPASATGLASVPGPASATGLVSVPGPAIAMAPAAVPGSASTVAADGPDAARVPEPAGSRPVTALEPLAPVIPLTVPPAAQDAPPRPQPADTNSASKPKARRRRLRVSPIGLAAVASLAVTAVFVLVGFKATPSTTAVGRPPAAPASVSSSAAAESGGGADAALPVKVKRQAGASPSAEPVQQSASTKNESLAVAASQPGTMSPSEPAHSSAPRTRTQAPASPTGSAPSTPRPAGTLVVTPDQLNLGSNSTGQLTLTAQGGPVSWSASSSSALTLSGSQGTLQAGQSVTLVVTVNRGSGGAGTAYVFINSSPVDGASSAAPSASQAVQVAWTSYHPKPPRPSPSPSASSSPSPSTSPSFSPVGAPSSSSSQPLSLQPLPSHLHGGPNQ
jgi:DNA-directed RNA polymerase specialized sigma24 family protein